MKLFNIFIACIIFIVCSCKPGYEPSIPKDLLISKTQVGKVKLGMTLTQMRSLYKGFKFEEQEVADYGICGGGNGIRVSFGDEQLFFVWCLDGKNKIREIIVLNKKYYTSNGIHVGMSVSELLKVDPDTRFRMNYLDSSERSFNKESNVHIIFSDEYDTIGKYSEKCPDCNSHAVNLDNEIAYLYIN
jgi:hypothetical protein